MGLLFLPLYVRYLGIEAYGLVGLFGVLQTWLMLLDAGMSPTLGREMARFTAGARSVQSIRDLLRSLEVIAISLACVISAGVWAAAGWLAHDWLKAERLSPDEVRDAIAVMAFVIALRFVEGIYRSALFGLQRQVWYNLASAAVATLRNVGALCVLVFISPTIGAFFLWQAFASALSVAVLAAGVYRALPAAPRAASFSIEALRGVWRFAGGMTGITLLAVLLTQVDKVLLSRLLTLEAFGYYVFAATVAGALYLLIAPIATALHPHLVELVSKGDTTATAAVYHRAAQAVAVLTVPAALLMTFYGEGAVYAWSGNAELAHMVAPILAALALGNLLNGFMNVPYQLQLANGMTAFAVKVNVVAVAVLVPAIIWVVPRHGALGAACVWVALNAGYVLIGIPLMHRRLLPGEKWRWYMQDTLLPGLGACVALALMAPFRPASLDSRLAWFAFLALGLVMAQVGAAATVQEFRMRMSMSIRKMLSA